MADQQSRGGKKEGQRNAGAAEKQQPIRSETERPAKGRPGGPKPSEGKTRHGKS